MKIEKLLNKAYFYKNLSHQEKLAIQNLFKDKSFEKIITRVRTKSSLEFLIWMIVFSIIVYVFFSDINNELVAFSIVIWAVIVFVLLEMLLNHLFRFADLKSFVFINFMNCFDEKFKYALNYKYYNNAIEDLIAKTNLLEKFNSVEFVGDSVNIKVENQEIMDNLWINRKFKWQIDIVWARVATSLNDYKSDGAEYYEDSQITNNHYFVKIKFPNAKNLIANEVHLKQIVNKWFIWLFRSYFEHVLFVMLFTWLYWLIIYWLWFWWNVENILNNFPLKPFYSIVILYVVFFILFWYLYHKINFAKKNKHKIKIRENRFDKIFESFCPDESYYKETFRKYFVPNLLEFVANSHKHKNYSLEFFDNEIHIKYRYFHIGENFWWWVKSTLIGYVLFYIDLRNILKLSLDLQDFYYWDQKS